MNKELILKSINDILETVEDYLEKGSSDVFEYSKDTNSVILLRVSLDDAKHYIEETI